MGAWSGTSPCTRSVGKSSVGASRITDSYAPLLGLLDKIPWNKVDDMPEAVPYR